MAEFKFNCPQCGQTIEADESFRGQTAECPYCGKGIVVPSGTAKPADKPLKVCPEVKMSTPEAAKPADKTQMVQLRCPHCGVTHEVKCSECGRKAKCTNCGNEFMTGKEPPVKRGWKRIFSSKGRASRKEYWICLFLPIPFTGLLGAIRRLHDLNKCEWWLLAPIACCATAAAVEGMELPKIFTGFMLYVWLIILGSLDGTSGDNDYGPDPKGRIGTERKTPATAITIPILTAITVVGTVLAMLVNSQRPNSLNPESADRQVQTTTEARHEATSLQTQETMSKSSADRQARDSHDTADMVMVDGVMIRRLPGDEFKKITDEDGDEMYVATLPEKDGFMPCVAIQSQRFDFSSMPITLQQMRNFTPQDIEEFMDSYIPTVAEAIKKELKEQGDDVDVTITERSGNTATFLVAFQTHYACQKRILDMRNGRDLLVTGAWKSSQDKSVIQACVDSARLAVP